jgi:peptide/nickel transport system ATP-binding protein
MSSEKDREVLLEVKDLSVSFASDEGEVEALDRVSFAIKKGQNLGLVGESGCGKSVSAFSIMRLLPKPTGMITHGEILLGAKDLLSLSTDDMRKVRGNEIGMIFQEPMNALNPVQKIGDQIAEVFLLHQNVSKSQAWQLAVDMLGEVGIPAAEIRALDYPHQLSGGMRQRVVIAMALACTPKLIIADEPTTALDVTVQAQILDLLKILQKKKGSSILLITHDLGVIAETCDEVCVMYAGRIVERASTKALFKNPVHAYTRGLLSSIPRMDGTPKKKLTTIPGIVPPLSQLEQGCRFAPRSGLPHPEDTLRIRPPFKEIQPGHWVEACPLCTA